MSQLLQWRIIAFSVSIMNIYNQPYGLATAPTGRNNNVGWYKTHNNLDILAKRLHPSVLLIGDSIVAGLSRYQTVYKKYFKPYKALNRGIPGERTQHVLWRQMIYLFLHLLNMLWFIVAPTT